MEGDRTRSSNLSSYLLLSKLPGQFLIYVLWAMLYNTESAFPQSALSISAPLPSQAIHFGPHLWHIKELKAERGPLGHFGPAPCISCIVNYRACLLSSCATNMKRPNCIWFPHKSEGKANVLIGSGMKTKYFKMQPSQCFHFSLENITF